MSIYFRHAVHCERQQHSVHLLFHREESAINALHLPIRPGTTTKRPKSDAKTNAPSWKPLRQNTSKAGCDCASPFVPQGKSHSPLIQIKLNLFFKTCLSNFSKVWPPAGPPEASLTAHLRRRGDRKGDISGQKPLVVRAVSCAPFSVHSVPGASRHRSPWGWSGSPVRPHGGFGPRPPRSSRLRQGSVG
ncbi:hypothetical protein SAMN05216233_12072 [Desulfoluna spongiiphila]|uniref:Uncharacterized protein n=1 Tax=Desulfoluna spongiiphila TaxID=419481 RepID=A0A1G5IJR3_9BACT|nr:hypothetical protein SAMN05216233_12072 [Desulfoluna spongiiphila]